MSKTNLVMLGTLALVLVSVAGRADTRTIPLSPDEHWWGLGVAWAEKMPITRGSRPFVADLAASNDVRMGASLLVSDRGRYVWCERPASFTVTEDALTVKADGVVTLYAVWELAGIVPGEKTEIDTTASLFRLVIEPVNAN